MRETQAIDLELWSDIAYELASVHKRDDEMKEETTIGWVAKKYGMTLKQAMSIVTHPKFVEYYHNMQQAIARVNFNRKAYDALDQIMDSGAARDKIAAIKLASDLLGYREKEPVVSLTFNLDKTIRAIHDGKVIDAEVVEEEYPGL